MQMRAETTRAISVSPGRALFLVENLSVPMDRRVWQEARTLTEAGYQVTVLCPMGRKQDRGAFERLDGVDIHRFPLETAAHGPAGYAREYSTAFFHYARLARKLNRRTPFDFVHACNPPDLLFVAALALRRQAAFIFDHHDLVPELYLSRFGRGRDLMYRGTLLTERLTFSLADVVISTNESYRDIAIERGRKAPGDVVVVRSAPDLSRFAATHPDPTLRRGQRHLLAYIGVMGPQDGVDHALRALAQLRKLRMDWHATFVGAGDVFEDMKRLADSLQLGGCVEFTGRVPDDELVAVISTADVGLAPDPWNPLNDASTMNKIVEYMALGTPIVSYDLKESRFSAGDAAVYVPSGDEVGFAAAISDLLDQPERRAEMGRIGLSRVAGALSWSHSSAELLRAYAIAADKFAARRRRGVKSRRAVRGDV
jgi:glycosyltransferase involved in cell wall biosynthesis